MEPFVFEEYATRSQASKRETEIKKKKSRKYMNGLLRMELIDTSRCENRDRPETRVRGSTPSVYFAKNATDAIANGKFNL